MAVALAIVACPVHAGQSGASFNVTVTLQAGVAASIANAFCRSTSAGAFGAIVTVVCSTGVVVDISPGRTGMPWSPIHGGAYRFLTQLERAGETFGTLDDDTGAGTTTSWRVVNLSNRDYLEMTVAW